MKPSDVDHGSPPTEDEEPVHGTQAALLKIGVALTSGLQMEIVLRTILDECRNVLPLDALYVALFDRAAETFQFLLFWDQGEYRTVTEPVALHARPSLTGAVIKAGRTLYLKDLRDPATAHSYPAIKVADAPTRAYVGVPMVMRGEVIGVLSIQHLVPAVYSTDQVQLLEMIATQAAVAVENARLYELAQTELAERALLADRLALATQLANVGIWEWKLENDELLWDERTRALYGVPAEVPATNSYWRTLIHPDDLASVSAEIQATLASQGSAFLEYRLIRPDGGIRHIYSAGGAVKDGHGQTSRVIGVNIDVTEPREMAEALRVSEQRYRMLAENAQDLIWTTDPQGCFTYLSPAVEQLFGYRPSDAGGLTLYEILTPESANQARRIIGQVLPQVAMPRQQDPSPLRLELEGVRKDGTRLWTESIATTIRDAEGKLTGLHGITRDVSQRHQQEAAIRQMNALLEQRVEERTVQLEAAILDLQQANRMKDEFLAAVSHELRTPLASILGIADTLEAQIGGTLSQRQFHYVQILRQSGERLLEMVDSILRYTSLLAGKRPQLAESCRLVDLAATAISQIQPKAKAKRIGVELLATPADVTVISDPEALVEILVQLLDNAVKFTPEAGRIGLTLHQGMGEKAVQLIVWDTGVGIEPELHSRIFAPLVQGDSSLARQYEGLGLGLAYVQRLVEALNGTIAVASTPGAGSRFTVTLPPAAASA